MASQHADEQWLSPPDPCAQLPGPGTKATSQVWWQVSSICSAGLSPTSVLVRPGLGNSPVPLLPGDSHMPPGQAGRQETPSQVSHSI